MDTAKFPKESDTIVHLNVGSARFTATVKTLTEHSGWFKALTRPSGIKLPLMDDGKTFFIDRDGGIFSDLLAFMRSGDLPAGSWIAGLVRAKDFVRSAADSSIFEMRIAITCKSKFTHSAQRTRTRRESTAYTYRDQSGMWLLYTEILCVKFCLCCRYECSCMCQKVAISVP